MVQAVNFFVAPITVFKRGYLHSFAINLITVIAQNYYRIVTVGLLCFNLPAAHAVFAARHIINVFCRAVTGNLLKFCFVKRYFCHNYHLFRYNIILKYSKKIRKFALFGSAKMLRLLRFRPGTAPDSLKQLPEIKPPQCLPAALQYNLSYFTFYC